MAAAIDPSGATPLPTSTSPLTINIGSRKSLLAVKQSEIVVDLLKKAWPDHKFHIEAVATMGDKDQQTALHQFNAKALWTFELENLLFDNKVDLIVHSCKDIPTQLPPESTIGAILSRSDPRDALVLHPSLPKSTTLASLPPGSLIGTSSVRRVAQLTRQNPHLRFESVRGNVNTRLRKLDESSPADASKPNYAGIILAAAGLLRVGEGARIAHLFSAAAGGVMHAVGQGALGVQVREGDGRIAALLAPLRDERTSLACLAERALMRTLEGGCSVPIGVETAWSDGVNPGQSGGGGDGVPAPPLGPQVTLAMRAVVVSVDGKESVEAEDSRRVTTDGEAEAFGMDLAAKLVSKGAGEILEKITLDRKIVEAQDNA